MASLALRARNTWLIVGKGWLAGITDAMCVGYNQVVRSTRTDMQDQVGIRRILDEFKPTRVICAAGKTGRPNVDGCEINKIETIENNVTGLLMLAMECRRRDIHLTVYATGCIYESTYNDDHTVVLSEPFKETDPANFGGSFYSYGKSRVEDLLKFYDNVLVLRFRMPVSNDLHPRSFVTKIINYDFVVNVLNSHTILPYMLPMALVMMEHAETGVYNFTNPVAISHNEVLTLYRDIVDPTFTWQNFALETQYSSGAVVAKRSNCVLDSSKLAALVKHYQSEGYQVELLNAPNAYRKVFEEMKANQQQSAGANQMVTA